MAVREGQTETVKALIAAGANIDTKDRDGNTLLHVAAHYGRTTTVKVLIAAGIDVNAKSKYGSTPLHRVAWHGQTETVKASGSNIEANCCVGLALKLKIKTAIRLYTWLRGTVKPESQKS